MSTTKRSRTTKKKEPVARGASRASPAPKAKRAPSRDAAPRGAASSGRSSGKPPPEPAPVKKARAKKAAPRISTAAVEPAPPPRPTISSAYTLDGPIPPEADGLSKKVGALLGVGQRQLGIKTFRPGQAEAFDHLLAGEDLLAVMPTGSGKSLLYQLTSLVVPGVTVVVSPLIALIKDQLDKMVARGVSACKIDSTLTVKQRREVDELVRSPGGKLLLTTPERMADPEFRVFLREACGGVGGGGGGGGRGARGRPACGPGPSLPGRARSPRGGRGGPPPPRRCSR